MRTARAVLAAALAVGLAVVPAPAAVAAPEWKQIFSTDFTGGSLPGKCFPYGGPHGGPADSWYSSDEVRVSGGFLRLGIRNNPNGDRTYATGGIGCNGLTQTYGKYEYRAKAPVGAGIDSYVVLWPADEGVEQHAALIEILAKPGNEMIYLSNEYGSGELNETFGGRFADGFHTYVIEWTPTSFRISIDGVVRMDNKRTSNKRRWIGFAVSSGDPLTGVPNSSTPLPGEFQVDWLRVYSYQGNNAPATTPGRPATKPGPTTTPPVTRATTPAPPAAVATTGAAPTPAPAATGTTDPLTGLTGLAGAAGGGGGWIWWVVAVAALALIGGAVGYTTRRPRRSKHSA